MVKGLKKIFDNCINDFSTDTILKFLKGIQLKDNAQKYMHVLYDEYYAHELEEGNPDLEIPDKDSKKFKAWLKIFNKTPLE